MLLRAVKRNNYWGTTLTNQNSIHEEIIRADWNQGMLFIILGRIFCLPVYHIFSHYLIKGTIFGKMFLNVKYVFWLQILSEKFLLIRDQRGTIINVKYSLFLSDFNKAWIFSTGCRRIFKYKSLWKSDQQEPSWSLPTDRHTEKGRTDPHDEANRPFSQFCKRT